MFLVSVILEIEPSFCNLFDLIIPALTGEKDKSNKVTHRSVDRDSVITSATLVKFYETARHSIPKGSHFHNLGYIVSLF
jgi:hypothetical protein